MLLLVSLLDTRRIKIVNDDQYKITEADIVACWSWSMSYLVDILNREYAVKTAREDLLSLIGSKYDPRVNNEQG